MIEWTKVIEIDRRRIGSTKGKLDAMSSMEIFDTSRSRIGSMEYGALKASIMILIHYIHYDFN